MKTRTWKVAVQIGESPTGERYYDNYLFIDMSGAMSERNIRMRVYHTLKLTEMFERPHVVMEYLRASDTLNLTVDEILQIRRGDELIKI